MSRTYRQVKNIVRKKVYRKDNSFKDHCIEITVNKKRTDTSQMTTRIISVTSKHSTKKKKLRIVRDN